MKHLIVTVLLSILSVNLVNAQDSPCSETITNFTRHLKFFPESNAAIKTALEGIQPIPVYYGPFDGVNPWPKDFDKFRAKFEAFFNEWCTFLPTETGSHGDGLSRIQEFAMFYYRNQAAADYVHGFNPNNRSQSLPEFAKFLEDFNKERGHFMDSADSLTLIDKWIANPRIEISDYIRTKASDYKSWNDFFTRELKRVDPSDPHSNIVARPVTMADHPERDYIVVAPTDCIMNPIVQPIIASEIITSEGATKKKFIENPIDLNDVIDVKKYGISIDDLLGSAPDHLKAKFTDEKASGLNCVLLPNTYHHFHSPVSGNVIYSELIQAGTWGVIDFLNWASEDGNAGRPGMDFSEFDTWGRAVIIIEVMVKNTKGVKVPGWVASVPVGLNTVGSVVLDDYIMSASETNPVAVRAGNSRLGNFAYGGSTNILLFSYGLMDSSAVQVRLGNQIGLMDTND